MSDSLAVKPVSAAFAQFLIENPSYRPLASSTKLYKAMRTVDMGPEPPTTRAGTFRIVLRYLGPDGALAENVLYGETPSYLGTQQQVQSLASAATGVMQGSTSLLHLVNQAWQLQSVIVQDNSGTGNFTQVVAGFNGMDTVPGAALPPNVAAVISWDVDKRYKGGHPRTYIPGVGTGNLATPGDHNWSGTYTTALKTIGKSFLDALTSALAAQVSGAIVGTLSKRANFQWKTPPDFWPYVDSKSHPRVDTQRRRLGKEITSGQPVLPIYSVSMYHGYVPTGFQALYTAPAGKVGVIRDIEAYNGDSSAHDVNFQVGTAGSTSILWALHQVAAATWNQWAGRVVIPPGASLWGYGGGSALIQATISGYELTQPQMPWYVVLGVAIGGYALGSCAALSVWLVKVRSANREQHRKRGGS